MHNCQKNRLQGQQGTTSHPQRDLLSKCKVVAEKQSFNTMAATLWEAVLHLLLWPFLCPWRHLLQPVVQPEEACWDPGC